MFLFLHTCQTVNLNLIIYTFDSGLLLIYVRALLIVNTLCRINDLFYTVFYMTMNMLVSSKYNSVGKNNFYGEEISVS